MTTAHGRLGLPAEFGLSWLLPRLVGLTHAADLLFSSRIVLAEEAAAIGLVNRVCESAELHATVREYAAVLASAVSPASLRLTKEQLYRDLVSGDPASSVKDALFLLEETMGSADFREGVAALREKRPPRFG